jgi:hypothetical protein
MIELNGVIVPNSFTFPKTDNLPQLAKEIILSENTWATAIYYALLSGMLVSIEKCWRIYMRNAEFTRSGELGEKIKRFNKQYPTFIDSLFKYKSLAQNENRCHDEHRELSRTAKGQLIYYLLYALSIIGFSLWHLTHIGILQYFFV